jgi:hypothetical protein
VGIAIEPIPVVLSNDVKRLSSRRFFSASTAVSEANIANDVAVDIRFGVAEDTSRYYHWNQTMPPSLPGLT